VFGLSLVDDMGGVSVRGHIRRYTRGYSE
jgi:hypothetical protein